MSRGWDLRWLWLGDVERSVFARTYKPATIELLAGSSWLLLVYASRKLWGKKEKALTRIFSSAFAFLTRFINNFRVCSWKRSAEWARGCFAAGSILELRSFNFFLIREKNILVFSALDATLPRWQQWEREFMWFSSIWSTELIVQIPLEHSTTKWRPNFCK